YVSAPVTWMSLPDFSAASTPLLSLVPLVALFGITMIALAVFAVRWVSGGHTRTARVAKQGGTPLLGEFFMEFGLWAVNPLTRTLIALKVTPDSLSWASLVIQLVACWGIATGRFGLGGWLLAAGAGFDA